MQNKKVACVNHGESCATFVCQHLADRNLSNIGFNQAYSETDERPDAWCDQCNKIYLEEGEEWNDRSEGFAKIKLMCSGCYDDSMRRNKTAYQV